VYIHNRDGEIIIKTGYDYSKDHHIRKFERYFHDKSIEIESDYPHLNENFWGQTNKFQALKKSFIYNKFYVREIECLLVQAEEYHPYYLSLKTEAILSDIFDSILQGCRNSVLFFELSNDYKDHSFTRKRNLAQIIYKEIISINSLNRDRGDGKLPHPMECVNALKRVQKILSSRSKKFPLLFSKIAKSYLKENPHKDLDEEHLWEVMVKKNSQRITPNRVHRKAAHKKWILSHH